jgi:O-acetyl-ADP-ribose deacetylase (regulator of RNase III)
MIHEVKGNLLDTNCQFICHQVNCQGKMNSGVAKAIREKWPKVYKNYKEWHKNWNLIAFNELGNDYSSSELMLGHIQIVALYDNYDDTQNHQYVINMAAQQFYGYDNKKYTSYDAFWSCLEKIKKAVPIGNTIAFPKNIGSCRGGANWNIIRTMIAEALHDYEVYIYELEE